ncbi:hypothetical protein B566_EDAN011173 [Ephemera danica]|nr:hypothetical protein B566_EDAN011173 [Ephemera danica]
MKKRAHDSEETNHHIFTEEVSNLPNAAAAAVMPNKESINQTLSIQYDSIMDDIPKTTNALEAWHRALQAHLNGFHPNVWKFFGILRKEEAAAKFCFEQLVAGQQFSYLGYPKAIDLVTSNCTANLLLCENSKIHERHNIQHFEKTCDEHRSAIAEQLRIHDELRATASSLKSQLADRNVTPHPSSQHGVVNLGSCAEFDLDSTEMERRVNASVDRRDTRT